MKLRNLIAGVAVVGLIVGLAPAASAAPRRRNIVEGIFDISALKPAHKRLVKQAMSCDDFDWSKLRKSLKAKTGRRYIEIEVADLSKWGAVGASWETGLVQLQDVDDPRWFQQIFMHEIGHMVDFYYLQPRDLQDKIAKLYGAPWSTMGHDFNGGFTNAFSCFDAGDANGYLNDDKVKKLRRMLGGTGAVPAKTM